MTRSSRFWSVTTSGSVRWAHGANSISSFSRFISRSVSKAPGPSACRGGECAREEAEAARGKFLHAERHQFDLALDQFRRALELSDAVGEQAWSGGIWEHREQLLVDISALETRAEGKR